MKKFLHVKMFDGSVWAVPLEIIAKSRAAFLVGQNSDLFDTAIQDCLIDENVLMDWSVTCMDWDSVRDDAVRVTPEPDYDSGWAYGRRWVEVLD